jgi:hypothetical protein
VTLYSYVVARDYGFAPNPFFGICTLATCKPKIRNSARGGDWIVGTGSAVYGLSGRIVYAMKVSEILSYTEYWLDSRFQVKKPNLRGSLKQAYGDNIYHSNAKANEWVQEDSHHSKEDGTPNLANVMHDTQTPKVLIGEEFTYWGGTGPEIPDEFRCVCAGRNHKSRFPPAFVEPFLAWIRSHAAKGYVGDPAEF